MNGPARRCVGLYWFVCVRVKCLWGINSIHLTYTHADARAIRTSPKPYALPLHDRPQTTSPQQPGIVQQETQTHPQSTSSSSISSTNNPLRSISLALRVSLAVISSSRFSFLRMVVCVLYSRFSGHSYGCHGGHSSLQYRAVVYRMCSLHVAALLWLPSCIGVAKRCCVWVSCAGALYGLRRVVALGLM